MKETFWVFVSWVAATGGLAYVTMNAVPESDPMLMVGGSAALSGLVVGVVAHMVVPKRKKRA